MSLSIASHQGTPVKFSGLYNNKATEKTEQRALPKVNNPSKLEMVAVSGDHLKVMDQVYQMATTIDTRSTSAPGTIMAQLAKLGANPDELQQVRDSFQTCVLNICNLLRRYPHDV